MLGMGEIGSALAMVLSDNHHVAVNPWDKNADVVRSQQPLEAVASSADAVFACVPTWVLGNALHSVSPFLKPDCPIVTVSKGYEMETCKTVTEIMRECFPDAQPRLHLAGPMLAEELMRKLPTVALLAGTDRRARTAVKAMFRGTALTIRTSSDVVGATTAGALKNAYAIGLGIAESLAFGDNARGWLIALMADEMTRIVVRQGGKRTTALGIAGLGDLVATGTSARSGNRAVGVEIAHKQMPSKPSEGLRVIACAPRLFGNDLPSFPVLHTLHRIVEGREDAALLLSLIR